MTHIDTAALKSTVTMMALLERDGHTLKKITDHFVCLCPFHREKTPSCHVWSDHLNCFGCNAHEDAIGYIRKTRSLTFREAVSFLSGGNTAPSTFVPLPHSRPAIPLSPDFSALAKRWSSETTDEQMIIHAARLGVLSDTLWWLGAGWAREHNAWAFPMHDGNSRVIGIRLRDDAGRKWAVRGSQNGLFLTQLEPDSPKLFITEGPTDAAACLTLGFYAIGRPSCNGAVSYVLQFLREHRQIREVVLITDNDAAGIKGADILRAQLPCRSFQLLLPPKDIRRFVQIGGGRTLIEAMLRSQIAHKPK